MMMYKTVLISIATFLTSAAWGQKALPLSNPPTLSKRVEQYFSVRPLPQPIVPIVPTVPSSEVCLFNPSDCLTAVCDRLGVFGCNSVEKMADVTRACRGNFNGMCVRTACDTIGTLQCNQPEEVLEVARSCRGNYDDGCLRSVCDAGGPLGCNQLQTITSVARMCGGEE